VTTALKGQDIARQLEEKFPGSVSLSNDTSVVVETSSLLKVAEYLKTTGGLDFNFLANLTASDYMDYFEVVYHLVSMDHNHSLVLKTRCNDREKPVVPSVYNVWRTAEYQERETYDLMGIVFEGHPFMKRLFLWEGFPGHPLRRDYL
jgi:NADH-quinone oxidoreductase subunit C